jgi:hypothetical protein
MTKSRTGCDRALRRDSLPRGVGPLTPDPSPRGGEGDRDPSLALRPALSPTEGAGICPLTPDPSPRWGEGDRNDVGLAPLSPRGRGGPGSDERNEFRSTPLPAGARGIERKLANWHRENDQ